MNKKNACAVIVSMLLLLATFMATIQNVEAEDTTVLYVDPSSSYAPVGESFSINISIFDVTKLHSWRFDLEWDANLLEVPDDPTTNGTVEGITEGSFLNQNNTFLTVSVSKMKNENTLSATCALKGVDPYDAPSGSGTLATVTFLVKAEGECPLHFNFTRLLKYEGIPPDLIVEIPHISEDGYFDNRMPFKVFDVVWENIHYRVSTLSNSTVAHLVFNQTLGQISFNVTGSSGTVGYCNVTIPNTLLWGDFTVLVNGEAPLTLTPNSNATHDSFYFTFQFKSNSKVQITATGVVAEIPSAAILPIFMIISLITVVFARSKKKK